jgi:hypothetical protein
MRVTLDHHPLGQGDKLFHCTVYSADLSGEHGIMHMVCADSMAKALYLAWCNEYEDEPFDIELCDGYLIGHIERSL